MSDNNTFPGVEGTAKFNKRLKPVFPSTVVTSWGTAEPEYKDNAVHSFRFMNSKGFSDGQAQYDESYQDLQFVQKLDDGTIIPGLQSEQLLEALLERHKAMNERFPSRYGAMAITFMEQAIWALRARVEERMDRGVMGELKK